MAAKDMHALKRPQATVIAMPWVGVNSFVVSRFRVAQVALLAGMPKGSGTKNQRRDKAEPGST